MGLNIRLCKITIDYFINKSIILILKPLCIIFGIVQKMDFIIQNILY